MKCSYCNGNRNTPGGCCYLAWSEAVDVKFSKVFPWVVGIGIFCFIVFTAAIIGKV